MQSDESWIAFNLLGLDQIEILYLITKNGDNPMTLSFAKKVVFRTF